MFLGAIFDAEDLASYSRFKRRDTTLLIGPHRVSCRFINSSGVVRWYVDQYIVPTESIQQLMNRYRIKSDPEHGYAYSHR